MKNDERIPFIRFEVGGEYLAIKQAYLHSVMPPMTVSPLPFTANFIDGMVNVKSRVVPQVDLFKVFDINPIEGRSADTLIIIEYKRDLLAFPASSIHIDYICSSELSRSKGSNRPCINAQVYRAGISIACIDIVSFFEKLSSHDKKSPPVKSIIRSKCDIKKTTNIREKDYLVVDIDQALVAISLDAIDKIVALERISLLPCSSESIAGTQIIDGRMIPVIAKNGSIINKRKIECLILENEGFRYGMVIDAQYGLQSFDDKKLFIQKETQKLSIRRDGLPIVIGTPNNLISNTQKTEIKRLNSVHACTEEKMESATRSALILSSHPPYIGIDIQSVYRLLPQQRIEPLPFDHSACKGGINIEGKVVPILDISTLLGRDWPVEEIMILKKGRQLWGFSVPRCDKIVTVTETETETETEKNMPFFNSNKQSIDAFVTYEKQIMILLNAEWLCSVHATRKQKTESHR